MCLCLLNNTASSHSPNSSFPRGRELHIWEQKQITCSLLSQRDFVLSLPLLSSFLTYKGEHNALAGSYRHTTRKVQIRTWLCLVSAKLQYGMELELSSLSSVWSFLFRWFSSRLTDSSTRCICLRCTSHIVLIQKLIFLWSAWGISW